MGIFSVLKRKPNAELILSKKEKIQKCLIAVKEILFTNDHPAQAEVIQGLIEALSDKDVKKFLANFHTVDMWGGSGSVWEVGFNDNETDYKYMKAMIWLIYALEEAKITNCKMRSVKKYFLKKLPLK